MHIIKRPLSILLSLLLIISVFTIIPITTASAETVQVFARKWVQAENVTGDYFSFTDLYQNFIICRGAPSFDKNNFNIDDTTNVYNRTGDISLGSYNEIRLNSWNDGSGHLNFYTTTNGSASGDGKIYLSTNGDSINFNTDGVTWYAYTWETFSADHVDAVAADVTDDGNIEYYTAGGRYFKPIEGTTDGHQNVEQITQADTVIPATNTIAADKVFSVGDEIVIPAGTEITMFSGQGSSQSDVAFNTRCLKTVVYRDTTTDGKQGRLWFSDDNQKYLRGITSNANYVFTGYYYVAAGFDDELVIEPLFYKTATAPTWSSWSIGDETAEVTLNDFYRDHSGSEACTAAPPQVLTATVTDEVTTEPGNITEGVRTYTATATAYHGTFTDTKTEPIEPIYEAYTQETNIASSFRLRATDAIAHNGLYTVVLLKDISDPYEFLVASGSNYGKTLKVKKNGHSVTVTAPTCYTVTESTEGDVTTYTLTGPDHDIAHATESYLILDGTGSSCQILHYMVCPDCGESVLVTTYSPVEAHAAVPATCTADGNVEYYVISLHGLSYYFVREDNPSHENEVKAVNRDDVIIASDGHTYSADPSTYTWTWTPDGGDDPGTNNVSAHMNVPCTQCDHVLEVGVPTVELDSSATVMPTCVTPGSVTYEAVASYNGTDYHSRKTFTLPAGNGHDLTHHAAVAATPTTDGNIEYWQCSVCNKYFSDAQGTNEITQAQTVVSATGVAQLDNGVKFTSLKAAVAAITDSDPHTITLLADSTGTSPIEVYQGTWSNRTGGKNITIDLNGYTYTHNGQTQSGAFVLAPDKNSTEGSSLIIKDDSADHDGMITSNNQSGTIICNSLCAFELQSGTVRNTLASGVALQVIGNGEAAISGGTLTATGSGGMAVYMFPTSNTGSELNITDGTIIADYAVYTANGSGAQITIEGGEVTGNSGWAFLLYDDADVTMTGGTVNADDVAFYSAEGSVVITDTAIVNSEYIASLGDDAEIAISGGTFDHEVPEEYCAEGFIPEDNGDGTYTVKEGAYVAQVGDDKYETLAAAVEAANGEAAIKVLADGQSYQLSVGESFKLALDTSYTPTFTSANAEYYVTYTTETNWYNVYLAQYAVKAVVPNYGTYYFTEEQMNSDHWLYNVYNGTTITLLTDMTYTKSVSYGVTSAKSFTLDMGGHTLTFAAPAAGTHSIYSRSNNTITIRNGKIKFTTDDGFWMKGGTLNVEDGAILEATNGYSPIIVTNDGVVNIKPGANVVSKNSYAIATNGTSGNGGYTINITGGTVMASNAPAIYHANTGTLNISGEAEISGADALYIKSGTTNITGGTFIATGTYAAYTHNPNGTYPTGDAIVIESTTGYAAIDSISITDGMFITTDEGTKAVATYAYGSGQEEQTGFISGGLFSTPVAEEHCADGYKPVENGDGTYGVTEKLFAGHSLSLKGDIAANFYLNLTVEQATVTTVSFEWDNHTLEDVPVVYDEYYDLYKVSCPVYAAYMTSDITATVTIDDEVQDETDVYSVERYARVILEDEEYITGFKQTKGEEKYNKLAALVKAMLNYGDAAQTYFNINTDAPANRSLSTDDKTVPAVTYEDINKPYNSQTTNLPAGVEFKSVTLSLRSETTLSLYFKSDETLSFSCSVVGLTVQREVVGSYQVARIRGFKAKELGNFITLTVTAGQNSGTVSYCPMTYCYNILKKGTNEENLPEVVTALYWYWQKAVTYFTNN